MTDSGEWKKYRRTNVAEMRSVRPGEFAKAEDGVRISISDPDAALPQGEFERGFVARNPDNHADQWYVNPTYFAANFEAVE